MRAPVALSSMKLLARQVFAKLPLRYLTVVELLYGAYEMALRKNPSHDSLAMLPGLLLAALTFPSDAVLYYAVVYFDNWFHVRPSDINGFLVRFLAVQLVITMNVALLIWYFSSSNANKAQLKLAHQHKPDIQKSTEV